MSVRAAALTLALVAAPVAAAAQGLVDRVAGVGDGAVRFHFATLPDVQICDRGIRMGDHHHMMWRGNGGWDADPRDCRYGPLEVEVEVRAGGVRDVTVLVPWRSPDPDGVDLGEVGAAEAVGFFRTVALGAGSDRAAREAILPMALADVTEAWRPMMEVARDGRSPSGARKSALFWVGQAAADAATGDLADVARDGGEDQEVRDAAVFALSQRPRDEGVPILMELARQAEHAETRRKAMFWLAQSNDERVVAFFEDILLGRSR